MSKRFDKRTYILIAVIIAMFISAIEATIVSTALPLIISEIGGFEHYTWVFSGYLLVSAATIIVYGKLADTYGRKPMMLVGLVLFLIGSLFCGFSNNMQQLIISRLIQGAGGGAIMTLASTIIGDIYTKAERASIQGYLSSVWAISAILGPALGSFFVSYGSWELVFWVNIPLVVIVFLIFTILYKENFTQTETVHIPYRSIIPFTVFIGIFLLFIIDTRLIINFISVKSILLVIIMIISILTFYLLEKTSTNRLFSDDVLKDKLILNINLITFFMGIILFGITTFLPTYLKLSVNASPYEAGLALTTVSIGWPLASIISAKYIKNDNERKAAILGGIALVIGTLTFLLLPTRSPIIVSCIGSFFTGIGMGFLSNVFIVTIQSSCNINSRASLTAMNSFIRMLGNTIGAAVVGGISNIVLHETLSDKMDINKITVLLKNNTVGSSESVHLIKVINNLGTVQFSFIFVIAIVCFILVQKNFNLCK
ncbi:MAG: transporter [Bacillales bacterium]|nr:transporter [Bacillales bacterium]